MIGRAALLFFAALVILPAGGCLADEKSSGPSICSPEKVPSLSNMAYDPRELTETIGVVNCWDADVSNSSLIYLNNMYSRWVVQEVGSTPSTIVRQYRAERRSAIERMFVGRARGTLVSLQIHMHDPDVDFTVPLVSLDYQGSRDGESFATLVDGSNMSLPDFRISPNSSVIVDVDARTAERIDVQASTLVLGSLRSALALASPTGSLLTSLNRDQVQKTASAFDATISKLLSSSIVETTSAGRVLSEWYPHAAFLVSVDVPSGTRSRGEAADPVQRAKDIRRLWFRVIMTCPRLSIFDTLTACESEAGTQSERPNMRVLVNSPLRAASTDPDYIVGQPGNESTAYVFAVTGMRERMEAHQVLNFRLGVGKTLRQFLTEQEWFISFSKLLTQSATPVQATDLPTSGAGEPKASEFVGQANQFCEAIVEKLYSAGLSPLDAGIGLWAVATGIPDFVNSAAVFQQAQSCTEHLPDAHTGAPIKKWFFAKVIN